MSSSNGALTAAIVGGIAVIIAAFLTRGAGASSKGGGGFGGGGASGSFPIASAIPTDTQNGSAAPDLGMQAQYLYATGNGTSKQDSSPFDTQSELGIIPRSDIVYSQDRHALIVTGGAGEGTDNRGRAQASRELVRALGGRGGEEAGPTSGEVKHYFTAPALKINMPSSPSPWQSTGYVNRATRRLESQ